MRYLLGSSFFEGGRGGATTRQLFSYLWWQNNLKSTPQPSRTVVICEGGSKLGFSHPSVDVVHLSGDLGYCGQLLRGEKKNKFSSWSASMLALALMAYDDEADFIYKESDCLAFGPWVPQMYADMGDGRMVFGPAHRSPPWMPCSQSLFLVKHSFIPTFVSAYLDLGTDGDAQNLGEHKFRKIADTFDGIRHLSFGVDRERPIPFDAPTFYAQQITPDEVNAMKLRGLV